MIVEKIARDVDPSIRNDLLIFYKNLQDIFNLWMTKSPCKPYISLSKLQILAVNNAVNPAMTYPHIKDRVLEVKFYHFFSYFDEKELESLIRLPKTSKRFSPTEREIYLKRKKECINAYLRLRKRLFSRIQIGYLDALKVDYRNPDKSIWNHLPEELKRPLNRQYLDLI